MEPAIFVGHSIRLFRKFDPSPSNDLKVQNFGDHVSGESPILVPPNFVKFYLFLTFAYPENFTCPSVSG